MPTTLRRRAALLTLLVFAIVAVPALAEAPEREVTVTPDNPATWDGTLASGLNQSYDAASGEPCGDELEDQCDTTLLHVDVPADFWQAQSGVLQVHLGDYLPNPASDFDLYIYESDAAGTRGDLVDTSADLPGLPETAEIPEASGYYLVQVVYFAVTASRYTATTEFVFRDKPAPEPPDVDDPPGLQDVLASDPLRGFRSHSEPHIAQSPTNPDLLIAASKMYNRDPDSLPEYEFKVGSYISFDGGRSWTDLGQTAVCPPEQAPPESWPENTCYPDEDPNAQGTGAEDDPPPAPVNAARKLQRKVEDGTRRLGRGVRLRQPATETRGSDYGEEYITSDPWVQFDDEGNAYLMVLDSPPFEHGAGWGMSFHRWESPSAADIESGDTWSEKIVINNYPNETLQPHFLDDKNTFAVSNAGPDGDGQTGTMVACWGQNITTLIKQQTVCERSTDGGRTWPGEPVPVSGVQQLVIGVSVVADSVEPDTFYAMWLHYVPGIVGLEDELWLAKSVDGGLTWTPPTLAARLTGIPRQFPGQDFRNLTIPHLATGPGAGEVYATYAEYLPASSEDDADGMQADIRIIKSTDGGLTWTPPLTVNGDGTDADQFQNQTAVTPDGQVNVMFFDRRHDPDNFYIDTYLARSNDGGATFEETRVSHEMWDPSINPPISGSGEFIGDYQGLVADDCVAIPFVNDTHLANDPARDPEFDAGLPRSEFQEVFSWRVPNTAEFGGRPVEGANCPGP